MNWSVPQAGKWRWAPAAHWSSFFLERPPWLYWTEERGEFYEQRGETKESFCKHPRTISPGPSCLPRDFSSRPSSQGDGLHWNSAFKQAPISIPSSDFMSWSSSQGKEWVNIKKSFFHGKDLIPFPIPLQKAALGINMLWMLLEAWVRTGVGEGTSVIPGGNDKHFSLIFFIIYCIILHITLLYL